MRYSRCAETKVVHGEAINGTDDDQRRAAREKFSTIGATIGKEIFVKVEDESWNSGEIKPGRTATKTEEPIRKGEVYESKRKNEHVKVTTVRNLIWG